MPRLASLPLATAAFFLALTASVAAQDYPTKPIRMIIPFPPGGGSDVTGRVVATALSERLGQQVIVDNRAGAGGVIGSELAANAPKDGYTLLMVSLAHTVNPWLYDLKGRYDPIKSFAPVAIIAASPVVLVVNPSVPAKSVAELVALAKKQPGKLQYASAGVGSVTHLAGELFKYTAKVDMLHVPFRGAGPATIDVVGGHTSLMFGGLLATVAADPFGQAARARRRLAQAQSDPSGRAVDRRSRRARLRDGQLVRAGRAGGHAGRPSSSGCTGRSPRCRTCRRCRSSSTPTAPPSCG